MLKRTIPVLLALTVLLTACGPQATPTMNAADSQNTAVAAAWTIVAETQAANPTATPLPPTETPSPTALPTFTQVAFPTSTFAGAALPTATQPVATSNAGNCQGLLSVGEAGPTTPIRIENESGGNIFVISLALWEKNAFGQCGYLAYNNIGKNASINIDLPKGKWYAIALIEYKGGGSSSAEGNFELRVGDDLIRLIVNRDVITVKGP